MTTTTTRDAHFSAALPDDEPAGLQAAEPDAVAVAAMRALSREHPLQPHWGAAKTVLAGALTFGVLPLFAWPKSLRTAATIERQQLWHLGEWARLRSGHPDADRLPTLADRVGFKPILWTLSMVCVAVVALGFVHASTRYGFEFEDLRAATYSFGSLTPPHLPGEAAKHLFVLWSVGLCLAYTVHWFHIQLHNSQVRRFVESFNDMTRREGINAVTLRPLGLGIRPIWLIGAIALVSVGGIWGIPLCLAGVLQGRWRRQSREVRAGLADSLRQMLMLRRPAVAVPRPATLGTYCGNDLCRGRVPPLATFCPRCGQQVQPPVAGAGKVA